MIEVRTTQAELDKALAKTNQGRGELIVCMGAGPFTVRGSATVEASGSATVRAWGSATVEASGSATVRASGSATVRGTRWTPVIVNERHRENVTISGGQIIEIPTPKSPEEWCEFHGVEVTDGIATLFKAVDAEWRSSNKTPAGEHITYAPGKMPEAPDWDGGEAECGGGLHFSPSPAQARSFHPAATRYVACPVRLSDLAIHPEGNYPEKCKAARVTEPGCREVTIDGEAVDA